MAILFGLTILQRTENVLAILLAMSFTFIQLIHAKGENNENSTGW